VEVAFILKEVQVPPSLVLRIVNRLAFRAACAALEPSLLSEVQVDVQFPRLFVKPDCLDINRLFDPKCYCE
jgi:hypothetical protein